MNKSVNLKPSQEYKMYRYKTNNILLKIKAF